MIDRLVNGALWFLVMALIASAAIGSMLLSYRGLFEICAKHLASGTTGLCIGTVVGVASYMLARNANDLMDR